MCFYSPYFYFMGMGSNGSFPPVSRRGSEVLPGAGGVSAPSTVDVPQTAFRLAGMNGSNVNFGIFVVEGSFYLWSFMRDLTYAAV